MNKCRSAEEHADINIRCKSLFQFQFFRINVQQFSKCENNYFKNFTTNSSHQKTDFKFQ